MKDFVLEHVVKLQKEKTTKKVQFIGCSYYVIFANDEIKKSTSDIILDLPNIKIVFAFPHVEYAPDTWKDKSFLSPLIAIKNKKLIDNRLRINDWVFRFEGQRTWLQVDHRLEINMINKSIEFSRIIKIPYSKFELHYRLITALAQCTNKDEAEFVFEYYEKDKIIDNQRKEITRLRAEVDSF